MNRILFPFAVFVILALCGSVLPSAAQAPSANEEKLREALKGVTLQLRTAESEKAVALAEKAAADQLNGELTAKVEKMSKQLLALSQEKSDALDAATRVQATLEGKLTSTHEELVRYQKSLDKWKAAHSTISDIAKKKEAARADHAVKNAALERRVADLRTRNGELFKTANEILDRYRKFSLGEAITAREPFTGLTRVKLQNIHQEFNDQLLDQTAQP